MYHYVRTVLDRRDRVGIDLSVTPAHFAQQMALLHDRGFHTITFDDLLSAIYSGTSLPAKPIIISFDDGYEDYYTTAFPILQKYGFRSTGFIITGKVGQPAYMTWDQLRQLQRSGLTQFESHTVDHADMGHMSIARAHQEMAFSKRTLEQELGTTVEYLCYPSGHYNTGVLSLLSVEGYRAGIGTRPGTVHSVSDIQALTRVRIHGSDTLASFAAKLGIAAR
jgi:peptidoglycan/xylan/chitin deacetylase (PgdA/CDA1 family)